MGAVSKYNGGNAFTLKPNGMDSRFVNKIYTPNQIPQTGLIVYYDPAHPNCYAGTGTSMLDLTANNNDGTLLGGLESGYDSTGWFQGDGINDEFETTGSVTLSENELTVGCWFKADGSSTLNYQFPVVMASNMLLGAQYSAGQWRAFGRLQDGTNTGRNITTTFGDVAGDTWYLGVITYDNVGGGTTGTLKMYLFGSTGLEATATRSDSSADYVTNNLSVKISTHASGAGHSTSTMGEVFVYNGAELTQSEIESIYENTKKRYGY